MNVRHIIAHAFLLLLLVVPSALHSETDLVVITHPGSAERVDPRFLFRLYFGKTTTAPDGTRAYPLLMSSDTDLLNEFARGVLGRSARQLRSYWARQIFTGRGIPPIEVDNMEQMKALVASNPGYIGYIPRALVDDSVRVLLTVD